MLSSASIVIVTLEIDFSFQLYKKSCHLRKSNNVHKRPQFNNNLRTQNHPKSSLVRFLLIRHSKYSAILLKYTLTDCFFGDFAHWSWPD